MTARSIAHAKQIKPAGATAKLAQNSALYARRGKRHLHPLFVKFEICGEMNPLDIFWGVDPKAPSSGAPDLANAWAGLLTWICPHLPWLAPHLRATMDLTLETDILRAIDGHMFRWCVKQLSDTQKFQFAAQQLIELPFHFGWFESSSWFSSPSQFPEAYLGANLVGTFRWVSFLPKAKPDLTKQLTMIETCAGIGAMITTPIFANDSAPRQMFR